jgi:hypothetical protein
MGCSVWNFEKTTRWFVWLVSVSRRECWVMIYHEMVTMSSSSPHTVAKVVQATAEDKWWIRGLRFGDPSATFWGGPAIFRWTPAIFRRVAAISRGGSAFFRAPLPPLASPRGHMCEEALTTRHREPSRHRFPKAPPTPPPQRQHLPRRTKPGPSTLLLPPLTCRSISLLPAAFSLLFTTSIHEPPPTRHTTMDFAVQAGAGTGARFGRIVIILSGVSALFAALLTCVLVLALPLQLTGANGDDTVPYGCRRRMPQTTILLSQLMRGTTGRITANLCSRDMSYASC